MGNGNFASNPSRGRILDFQNWLEQSEPEIIPLPEGSFSKTIRSTMVSAKIVVIHSHSKIKDFIPEIPEIKPNPIKTVEKVYTKDEIISMLTNCKIYPLKRGHHNNSDFHILLGEDIEADINEQIEEVIGENQPEEQSEPRNRLDGLKKIKQSDSIIKSFETMMKDYIAEFYPINEMTVLDNLWKLIHQNDFSIIKQNAALISELRKVIAFELKNIKQVFEDGEGTKKLTTIQADLNLLLERVNSS
jgi:hypothetical protein